MAIWLTGWLVRLFWKNRSTNPHAQWFSGVTAVIRLHKGPLIRIEIEQAKGFHSKPGQHCFLRFPHLSILDNHPFTIASAPSFVAGLESTSAKTRPRLLFLARAKSGFTKKARRAVPWKHQDNRHNCMAGWSLRRSAACSLRASL